MDIQLQNEETATRKRIVEIVKSRELHYSCGCTTTQIESRRCRADEQPGCQGHGGVLLKTVEILEYGPAYAVQSLRLKV